jgi:hypothetical protein
MGAVLRRPSFADMVPGQYKSEASRQSGTGLLA